MSVVFQAESLFRVQYLLIYCCRQLLNVDSRAASYRSGFVSQEPEQSGVAGKLNVDRGRDLFSLSGSLKSFELINGAIQLTFDRRLIAQEFVDYYVDLDDLKLNIHLVKENDVLSEDSTSSTKFMHRIRLVMARHYCDNLSEEVKKGMNKKASLGQWPSKPPLGYTRNTRDHLIYTDPQRAPLIHRLFKEYATGNHSLQSLTVFAYKIGLRSVNGIPVNKPGIHRILNNIMYSEKFFVYKGKLHDTGIHEPIVSQELFQAVQQTLNGGFTPKQTKRNFAFRGVLKCHQCGCSMTPDIKKGKYIYYRCTQYRGKCKNSVSEQKLVELFGNAVREVQISPKAAEGLKAALRESHADKEAYHRDALRSLRTRYDLVRRYQERAYEDRLNGIINERLWKKKSGDWNAELQDIEAQIEIHRHANREYLELGNQIIELAKNAYNLYLHQTNHERRKLLDHLHSNCTIADVTLCPTYKKAFDILAEGARFQSKRG